MFHDALVPFAERRIIKMTKVDWITMVVPIIFEGLLLFLFQKAIEKRIDRQEKRNELRDKIIVLFWEKLQALNNTMIRANFETHNNANLLQDNLYKIRDSVFEIIQFYDTNKYDLAIYEKEYIEWNDSWNHFVETLSNNSNKMTKQIQSKLGNELQEVKNNTCKLIEEVRKKY